MSERREQLLYVVSARKELAWHSFKQIFDSLYLRARSVSGTDVGNASLVRADTVRALESLAHCDFEFGGETPRVFAAPAMLSRLPRAGLPKAVLSGARSSDTLRQVTEVCGRVGCRVEIIEQDASSEFVPARIELLADTDDKLVAAAAALGLPFVNNPPPWTLINFAGSIAELLEEARWKQASELTWRRTDFDPNTLQFRANLSDFSLGRLSRYANPTTGAYLHILEKDNMSANIDCDWGRYAILHECGFNVLVYDERRQLLAVPVGAPLPRLIARSVTSCSGYAPLFVARRNIAWPSLEMRGYRVFRWLPLEITELAAHKLGQSLVPHPIHVC